MEKKTFWQKVKERVSSENISKTWKQIRNISGVIASIGGALLIIPESILTIPAGIVTALYVTTAISGAIAGRAQLNTGKEINAPKWLKTVLNAITGLSGKRSSK